MWGALGFNSFWAKVLAGDICEVYWLNYSVLSSLDMYRHIPKIFISFHIIYIISRSRCLCISCPFCFLVIYWWLCRMLVLSTQQWMIITSKQSVNNVAIYIYFYVYRDVMYIFSRLLRCFCLGSTLNWSRLNKHIYTRTKSVTTLVRACKIYYVKYIVRSNHIFVPYILFSFIVTRRLFAQIFAYVYNCHWHFVLSMKDFSKICRYPSKYPFTKLFIYFK